MKVDHWPEPITAAKVQERLDEIRVGTRGKYWTNYFNTDLAEGEVAAVSGRRTLIFLHKEFDFFRLYFFSADLAELGAQLMDLSIPGNVVAGCVERGWTSPWLRRCLTRGSPPSRSTSA